MNNGTTYQVIGKFMVPVQLQFDNSAFELCAACTDRCNLVVVYTNQVAISTNKVYNLVYKISHATILIHA